MSEADAPAASPAQSAVLDWWASKSQFVRSRGGYKIRRGLVEQVQRLAVAEAHTVAARFKLSDADADKLVAFVLETAKVPEW